MIHARRGFLVLGLLSGLSAFATDASAFHGRDEVREARQCRRMVRAEMPGRKAGRHLQSLRIAAMQRCLLTGSF